MRCDHGVVLINTSHVNVVLLVDAKPAEVLALVTLFPRPHGACIVHCGQQVNHFAAVKFHDPHLFFRFLI